MKQKYYLNHAVQEGVFFLLLGGSLLFYSLDSYSKSFNKDWTQSPSLFPVVVSVLMGLLAIIVLAGGIREKNAQAAAAKGNTKQVLIILGMSLLYYLALAVIKMPYLAVTAFSLTFTLSTFEVATCVFLLVLMLYLGVRSKPVLIAVPVGSTVFLSIMFRTLLRVLLP